ncbi:hypothetical protein [Micromonospora cathayae]|uniref:BON domain-containing protein n=1 Tax=Micromonospora cathayae TaxID=3028804 RepID=A0ABY7ZM85_9ACTN|nr:hypothetical protein [Micromonospora sp. HUAS 3]WDZ84015.1 hypothetical protein PVK37_26665 [Micromonospora sp. HUAS 3]
MGDVLRALMADSDEERDRYLDREFLRQAVMRAIFCERSGVALDVDRAVMVTTVKGDHRTIHVLDGPAWDEAEPALRALAAKLGREVEVIDGRQL